MLHPNFADTASPPHLNGKVERSQLTDRVEFWRRHSRRRGDRAKNRGVAFRIQLAALHGGLGGKTPGEPNLPRLGSGAFVEDVALAYDESKERLQYAIGK